MQTWPRLSTVTIKWLMNDRDGSSHEVWRWWIVLPVQLELKSQVWYSQVFWRFSKRSASVHINSSFKWRRESWWVSRSRRRRLKRGWCFNRIRLETTETKSRRGADLRPVLWRIRLCHQCNQAYALLAIGWFQECQILHIGQLLLVQWWIPPEKQGWLCHS